MMTYTQPLIGIVFVWAGFVCAISFMEAWLKFRAPGVTLPVGLSIGRLVFSALNKVEWSFALVAAFLLIYDGNLQDLSPVFLLLPVLLLLQTTWLLPAMNKRAELVIAGAEVSRSSLHFYYIGAELLKLVLLVMFGIQLFHP